MNIADAYKISYTTTVNGEVIDEGSVFVDFYNKDPREAVKDLNKAISFMFEKNNLDVPHYRHEVRIDYSDKTHSFFTDTRFRKSRAI